MFQQLDIPSTWEEILQQHEIQLIELSVIHTKQVSEKELQLLIVYRYMFALSLP